MDAGSLYPGQIAHKRLLQKPSLYWLKTPGGTSLWGGGGGALIGVRTTPINALLIEMRETVRIGEIFLLFVYCSVCFHLYEL